MSTQSELASIEVRIDREDTVCRQHNHDYFEQLSVSVLGMNTEELAQNPRLDSRIVHDVNADTALPFDDDRFDAIICRVSVESLLQPVTVVREPGRKLKPGAPVFAVRAVAAR